MVEPKYREIGDRMRDFGLRKFKTLSEFAAAIGMRPQTLNNYLSGNVRPGNIIQGRLQRLECDISWLMYGKTIEELNLKLDDMFLRKVREMHPNKFAMLDYLEKIGINSIEDLEKFCDPQNIAQDVAMVLRERIAKYKIKKK